MKINSYNISRITLGLLLLIILVYVSLRAHHISFTFDESVTYLSIPGEKIIEDSANNHLLNTFLMRICNNLFGNSEFSLRLPNVLSFLVYLIFCYKILIRSKKPVVIFAGFALLVLNPYLLDFFGLARGYGLSLGPALASLYFLLRDETYTSAKRFLLNFAISSSLSLLASFANLNIINLSISVLIVFSAEFLFLVVRRTIKLNIKNIVAVIFIYLVNAALLFILIQRLLMLQNTNQLYFGGSDGFIPDTLRMLIYCSIYFSDYGENFETVMRILIIVLFALMVVYQFLFRKINPFSKITVILLLMIIAPILQNYFFAALYPVARTSLMYLPLFGLCLFYFIEHLVIQAKKVPRIIIYSLVFVLVCGPLTYHFIENINFQRTSEWSYDANTKQVMLEINKTHQEQENLKKRLTVSNSWLFEPTMNYYRIRYSMDFIDPLNEDGVKNNTDFIYCFKDEKDNLPLGDSLRIIDAFKNTDTYLIRRVIRKLEFSK